MPFQRLTKPLAAGRIVLITTAAAYQAKADQGPGAPHKGEVLIVYSGDTAQDHDPRISHLAIDRKYTTAVDPASYLPLLMLRECVLWPHAAVAARFLVTQPTCRVRHRKDAGEATPPRCGESRRVGVKNWPWVSRLPNVHSCATVNG